MKNEFLKIGNTQYHLPTYGPMKFKDFKNAFPDLRRTKEIYDLIYLEYHGKPNDYKGKPTKEKIAENAEQPTNANGSGEVVVSEPGV